jgi:glycosyltransferase involved in cell wall biosynthesis
VRILFVEPFGQHEGHPPVESQRVTDALTEAGVSVTLVTFDGVRGNWVENSRIERHISVVSQYRILSPALQLFQWLRRFLVVRFFAESLETMMTMLLAIRVRKRQIYDAIHVFDGAPLVILTFATLLTKNCGYVMNIYAPPMGWGVKGYYENILTSLRKRDLRHCAHFILGWLVNNRVATFLQRIIYEVVLRKNRFSYICHTRELKEAHKTYLGGIIYDKIHVIPLGRVAPQESQIIPQKEARQYLHLPDDKRVLLVFGSNHLGKNLEVIFEAVKKMPWVTLLFAGRIYEGGKTRNPTLLAQKYGWIENTIVIDQFVSKEEVPYYFYASDAIILSHVRQFIMSASVLNEACRFQLPVIASDAGQLGEYVKNYCLGITFKPEEADSLRQAITSCLNLSEEERQVTAANFKIFAADLPWQKVVKRYIALYSSGSSPFESKVVGVKK